MIKILFLIKSLVTNRNDRIVYLKLVEMNSLLFLNKWKFMLVNHVISIISDGVHKEDYKL
jgi:hypothetical protein